MAKESKKRKSLDVDADLHRRVKVAAAKRGVRVRDVVERAIREHLTREDLRP